LHEYASKSSRGRRRRVDQMARLALALADRAYVISSGRIVFAGSAEALKNNPVPEKAYLGGE